MGWWPLVGGYGGCTNYNYYLAVIIHRTIWQPSLHSVIDTCHPCCRPETTHKEVIVWQFRCLVKSLLLHAIFSIHNPVGAFNLGVHDVLRQRVSAYPWLCIKCVMQSWTAHWTRIVNCVNDNWRITGCIIRGSWRSSGEHNQDLIITKTWS